MKIGYATGNVDYGIRPDEIAIALEERGFESWFVGEHPNIPVSRRSQFPAGGDLPDTYLHMMDPFVSLGHAAAVTSRLKLGTGVCLVLEHDLISLAKAVATLDLLSNGRVLFGVGCGWNEEELANHAPTIPFNRRFAAMRERIDALRTIWREEEPSYDGEFHRFEATWVYPKPVQDPLPVLIGMQGPLGLGHVVRYADIWAPVDGNFRDVEEGLARFRDRCEEHGRDPDTVPISMWAYGNPDQARLERYRDLGIDRVVIMLMNRGDRDRALRHIDRYAPMVAELGSP